MIYLLILVKFVLMSIKPVTMNSIKLILFAGLMLFASVIVRSQNELQPDSSNQNREVDIVQSLKQFNEQQIADSMLKAELQMQLSSTQRMSESRFAELQKQIIQIEIQQKRRSELKKQQVEILRKSAVGFPVTGVMGDTLFDIFTKFGVLTASERAGRISAKIDELYSDDYFVADSLKVISTEDFTDIVYRESIVMSISEADVLLYGKPAAAIALELRDKMLASIENAKTENSPKKNLQRFVMMAAIIVLALLIFWLLGKAYRKVVVFLETNKTRWFKNMAYKDYVFLNEEQQHKAVLSVFNLIRWVIFLILLYIALSVIFSIFPFTRGWADQLIGLIVSPLKKVLIAIVNYFPNLFSIIVIVVIMRYFIRLVKYIFTEINDEKLTIPGFHPDWAMPTYSIFRILLYAFMFVLIFPFLPGSNSAIFKGVSVFIGVLFSLGSSSAITNMVAGLVITYMRPFKIGDRIKIGEITGDVIEKSLLVTRVRTPKNEEITIPNSSVLSGNTTNYTTMAKADGLIIYTTVTIGYDVPWREMHKALITAADRTSSLLKDPKPFVLQTSLDDFYVSYQLNAYTRDASAQAHIYSELHQHIQDCCNEVGIEIMSPHYRAARDGNTSTIPAGYLPEDYKTPGFNVVFQPGKEDEKSKD